MGIQEEKLNERLILLVEEFKKIGEFFQITFYSKTSLKITIFSKENKTILKRWYKNSLGKMILSMEEYICQK